jgi:hypothetical protein
MDAEALQNSNQDLSRAALELVKSTSFQATGFQQEVFSAISSAPHSKWADCLCCTLLCTG